MRQGKQVTYLWLTVGALVLAGSGCLGNLRGPGSQDGATHGSTGSAAPSLDTGGFDNLVDFAQNVWSPVLNQQCYGCHHTGAIAQRLKAGFIFADKNTAGALEHNFAMVRAYAALDSNLLLLKPSDQVDHYGGQVLDPNGAGYAALAAFVTRSRQGLVSTGTVEPVQTLVAQAVLPNAASQLHAAARLIANRLPTASEYAAVAANPNVGMNSALDQYLSEGSFYQRLAEGYNDMLLVDTYARNDTAVALFEDQPDVDWYNHVANLNGTARQVAQDQTNWALAHEPLNLIAYVARKDLPFTDVLTADYTVVNPYSACAYGVANQVVFQNPVHCSATDGAYDPYDLQQIALHPDTTVGVMATRAFLNRHPTTITNRNRHRFNTVETIFLGFDVLAAVPGRTPPASVTLPAPTMTSRSCTDCHAMVDPGASLFSQWDASGLWTDAPWYTDMFQAGYFGTPMPDSASSNRLAWLAAQMVQDPRFARQTVRVVYQILTGNTVALDPPLASDANFEADLTGHMVQKEAVDAWAAAFVASNYSIKSLVKTIVTSPLFQLSDVQPGADALSRQVLAGTFVHRRLITPESLNRNLAGIFGATWTDSNGQPNLTSSYYMFYGGIDSFAVTTRDPSFTAFKSDITLRMGTELACQLVPLALSNANSTQVALVRSNLFPDMLSTGAIGLSSAALRTQMAAMRFSLLNETSAPSDPEVSAMLTLYQAVQQQAVADGAALPAGCQSGNITQDPDGSVRAWMAVVSYLLTDEDFLFE